MNHQKAREVVSGIIASGKLSDAQDADSIATVLGCGIFVPPCAEPERCGQISEQFIEWVRHCRPHLHPPHATGAGTLTRMQRWWLGIRCPVCCSEDILPLKSSSGDAWPCVLVEGEAWSEYRCCYCGYRGESEKFGL